MKVLITGSSGMIGTNLGLSLLARGIDAIGTDLRPNVWTDRIPTTLVDLCAADAASALEEPTDLIVHLAANAKVHAAVQRPQLAHENIMSAMTVLELARRHGTPVILGSSREVYGNIFHSSTGENAVFIDESASPYSASKIAMEAMGHAYRRCYGMPVVVLRFSNVYGRYDDDLERLERVVPLFIQQIRDDAPLVIFGAEKRLDFTYIDDCVAGIVKTIEAVSGGRLMDGAINIASGRGSSLLELAGFIGHAVGKTPQITCMPTRVGEMVHYVADLSAARQRLGYRPKVLLPEGIRRAIHWRSQLGEVSTRPAQTASLLKLAEPELA